jgi:hypothetical protein
MAFRGSFALLAVGVTACYSSSGRSRTTGDDDDFEFQDGLPPYSGGDSDGDADADGSGGDGSDGDADGDSDSGSTPPGHPPSDFGYITVGGPFEPMPGACERSCDDYDLAFVDGTSDWVCGDHYRADWRVVNCGSSTIGQDVFVFVFAGPAENNPVKRFLVTAGMAPGTGTHLVVDDSQDGFEGWYYGGAVDVWMAIDPDNVLDECDEAHNDVKVDTVDCGS